MPKKMLPGPQRATAAEAEAGPLIDLVLAGDEDAASVYSAQLREMQRQGISALQSSKQAAITVVRSETTDAKTTPREQWSSKDGPAQQSSVVAIAAEAADGSGRLGLDDAPISQKKIRNSKRSRRAHTSLRSPSCGDKAAARLMAGLQQERDFHASQLAEVMEHQHAAAHRQLLEQAGERAKFTEQLVLAEFRPVEQQAMRVEVETQAQVSRQQQQKKEKKKKKKQVVMSRSLPRSPIAAEAKDSVGAVFESPSMPHIEAMAFRLQAAAAKRRGGDNGAGGTPNVGIGTEEADATATKGSSGQYEQPFTTVAHEENENLVTEPREPELEHKPGTTGKKFLSCVAKTSDRDRNQKEKPQAQAEWKQAQEQLEIEDFRRSRAQALGTDQASQQE
eukprot:COSAG05_NODE_4595_length_1448_cov_1.713121_1_plen_392_part_00